MVGKPLVRFDGLVHHFNCIFTLEGVHVAQVNASDVSDRTHVAGQSERATVVQILVLDTREPCNKLRCNFTYCSVSDALVRFDGLVHQVQVQSFAGPTYRSTSRTPARSGS